jgi:hypothetical protein
MICGEEAAWINSIEESPSCETNSHSAGEDIPHFLWNPTVHYRIYKSSLRSEALYNIS